MKKLYILSLFALVNFLFCFAQYNYDKQWKKVEDHEVEGKFESANKIVARIYKHADEEQNTAQIVKSFIYSTKFSLLITEDSETIVLQKLRNEIDKQTFPTNAILENVYARFLSQYLSKYQYKIRSRSIIDSDVIPSDIRLWDIQTFVTKIHEHFQHSIAHEIELQALPVEDFMIFLDGRPNTKIYRSSLYDILAYNALDFYKTEIPYSYKRDRYYTIGTKDFAASDIFIRQNLHTETTELISTKQIFQLFQKLEKLYQDHDEALVDIVLQRLRFAYTKTYNMKNSDLYINALTQLAKRYQNDPLEALIQYKLASHYIEISKNYYAKTSEDHDQLRIKALAITKAMNDKYPNSEGSIKCQLLQKVIKQKSIHFTSETASIPNKPALSKVKIRNVDTIFLKAYRVPLLFLENTNYQQKDSIIGDFISRNEAFSEKTYITHIPKDYYEHTSEIDIPVLPVGRYLITLSNTTKSENGVHVLSYDIVQKTNLSEIITELKDVKIHTILHRDTGKPISNAMIRIMNDKKTIDQIVHTNSLGTAQIQKRMNESAIKKWIIHENDTLYTNKTYVGKKYKTDKNEEQFWQAKPFVFTDRSIYRPGQMVHYKVVLIQQKDNVSSVVPNVFCEVIFNSDDGELKTLRLQTNEFGSFSGSFKLPKNVATGDFTITVDEDMDYEEDHPFWNHVDDFDMAEHTFKVEEYKRPRFEVNLAPITKNITFKDSVAITGTAKALLGSPITNATVTYSVERRTNVIYRKRKTVGAYEPKKIIKEAKTTTDAKGNFTIPFVTEIYEHIPMEDINDYEYHIHAEITDVNGETQIAKKTIYVNPSHINLDVETAYTIERSQPLKVTVNTTDTNNVPLQTKTRMRIYKLKSPVRVFVERPWTVPVSQIIPKDEFIKKFPHFEYDTNETIAQQEKATKVIDTLVDIHEKTTIQWNTTAWKSGKYLMETTAYDPQMQDSIQRKRTVILSDLQDTFLPDNTLFEYIVLNRNFKKEGFVKLKMATALRNDELNVKLDVFHKEKIVHTQLVTINKGAEIVKIPLSQEFTEQITIRMSFVKTNTFYENQFSFKQYQDKRYLTVETTTFRNKLQSGQQETWEFKILDLEKKASNAEVLASMYDESLDQFISHEWNTDLQHFRGNYYSIPSIKASNFTTTRSREFFNIQKNIRIPAFKDYLRFNWFGLDFKNITGTNTKYIKTVKQKTKTPSYTGSISGYVFDDSGLPLPGATVLIKGTTTGTTTDFDGFYTINASSKDTLVFSYVGFNPDKSYVGNRNSISVSLEASDNLEAVNVVAYGGAVNYTTSSAVVTVNGESLSTVPIGRLDQILHGAAAGVNVSTSSGQPGQFTTITVRGRSSLQGDVEPLFVIDGVLVDQNTFQNLSSDNITSLSVLKDAAATAIYGNRGKGGAVIITTKYGTRTEMIDGLQVTIGLTEEDLDAIETRKNLKETAFFYPHLRTDAKGNVAVAFEAPESLTRWKFQLFAHQKNGMYESIIKNAVTQKELMVLPNMPRFLREKDTIVISTKVTNLQNKTTKGIASLRLFDARTMESIDEKMHLEEKNKAFTITAKGNSNVSWKLYVPKGIDAIQYRVIAKAGKFSDGEESALPVLKNSILITEAKPLWVKPNEQQQITFSKLANTTSTTLKQHQLTLEYTSNPTWSALMSLPYLMEYPYECAEQSFARLYANIIATHILQSSPKIKEVFEAWKANGALTSDLEKNPELKSLLISETPWVRDAISETAKKQQLAQLFDKKAMETLQLEMWIKLEELQTEAGGFPWFAGGKENLYITLHILQSCAYLVKLGAIKENASGISQLMKKAYAFSDDRFLVAYSNLLKSPSDHQYKQQIRYIYTRTMAPTTFEMSKEVQTAIAFYLETLRKNWIDMSIEERAMIALSLERIGKHRDAKRIMNSLAESAVRSAKNGMYWKEMIDKRYYYTDPVEVQALLIEAFSEVIKDDKIVQELQLWLLQQKQTSQWATTKATTKAIYALLLNPKKFVSIKDNTEITIGTTKIQTKKLAETAKEAGTGYFKTVWNKEEVSTDKATITIKNKGKVAGYGAAYWQYFEELDNIQQNDSVSLQVTKKLYTKEVKNGKKVLVSIENRVLKVGDLITVRLIVDNHKEIEFVHLKDMRAAGLEPVQVLSSYKWQDGIGYYESTRDASTNFFFDRIPKGTFILEYELRVNNVGEFSNGITTIESMYAPEFRSHTKGIRIKVE